MAKGESGRKEGGREGRGKSKYSQALGMSYSQLHRTTTLKFLWER